MGVGELSQGPPALLMILEHVTAGMWDAEIWVRIAKLSGSFAWACLRKPIVSGRCWASVESLQFSGTAWVWFCEFGFSK